MSVVVYLRHVTGLTYNTSICRLAHLSTPVLLILGLGSPRISSKIILKSIFSMTILPITLNNIPALSFEINKCQYPYV